MARIKLLKITKADLGLWISGAREATPAGFFRRLKGTHNVGTNTIRSRNGSSLVTALASHSLHRFDDVRFQGSGSALYRNGVSIKSGLSSSSLRFLRMPPQVGLRDYLFVVDGSSTPFKVDSAGAVTNWGIAPPADGITTLLGGGPGGIIRVLILVPAASWTTTGVGVTVSDESTIIQVVPGIRINIPESILGTASLANGVDFETSFNDNSHIKFWIRVEETINLDLLQIQFDLTVAADFTQNYYTYTMKKTEPPDIGGGWAAKGAASLLPRLDDEIDIVKIGGLLSVEAARLNAIEAAATTKFPNSPGTWIRMRIPKSLFIRSGSASVGWADTSKVRITASTNSFGAVDIYLGSGISIDRSGGQIGTYRYAYTYLNSVTGSRSNANPTPITGLQRDQESTRFFNITPSSDAQVDKIEFWRSVGDGTRLFRAIVVDDTSPDDTEDLVGDYPGIASPLVTVSLENLELPTDNLVPFSTFKDVAGPHNAAAFWLNSAVGTRGRVYFSPIGRPESVKGFIEASNDDDPTQRLIRQGAFLYVLTEARLFQIIGTDPYTHREVFGVPGTSNPLTVVSTPIGIIYEARDGISVFDGSRSTLIAFDAVGVIFRGEAAEGIAAFSGTSAAYGKGEYFISNGVTTLALNVRARTWRNLGIAATALYYEEDTGEIIVSVGTKTLVLEEEGQLTDDGTSIAFEVEAGSVITSSDRDGIVEYIFIDANTDGVLVTPTIILDGVETALPGFITNKRETVEIAVGKLARVIGVRLTATTNKRIEIFDIEADIYLPGGAPQ